MNWLEQLKNYTHTWWVKTYIYSWWHYHYGKMSHEELEARIRADVTDEEIDRYLPPALRRYPIPSTKPTNQKFAKQS